MRNPNFLLLAGVLAAWSPVAEGRPTPLFELDFANGRKQAFDRSGSRTAADDELDALLDEGDEKTFSSADLERIADALRRYLRIARPRMMPRLVLFVYPGRISRTRLKELREMKVDIELLEDPCARAVCDDAVARHLELLGKAMKQPVLRTRSYAVVFNRIIVRRRLDLHGADYQELRFPAGAVVQAGKQRGHGRKLMKKLQQAEAGYEQQMVTLIGRRLRARRIRSRGAPVVTRDGQTVEVTLKIHSHRVRYREHVPAALLAAAEALASSSLTPPTVRLRVEARVNQRGASERVFTCDGHPLKLHRQGRLSRGELWATYIAELKRGGTHFAFSDDDARSGPATKAGPDDTNEVLAARMALFAPCLRAEAARNRRFKGVTLLFAVGPDGRARGLKLKQRGASSTLKRCLEQALARIRFGRHGGAPRQVEYPMHIQR